MSSNRPASVPGRDRAHERRRTDPPDTGLRRRHDDLPSVAWPIDTGDAGTPGRDPWVSTVRFALDRRAAGDVSSPGWAPDVVWRVTGRGAMAGDHEGPLGIARYHAALLEMSGGTFRQQLLMLQGSNGPIVTAHVRVFAARGEERLEMPSLLVFELAHLRIQRVTEMPGDQARWDRFWQGAARD
jgi:hypothetical protein